MVGAILDWFGWRGLGRAAGPHDHGHTHGAVDTTISTNERGIWSIKWSFAILAATAAIQLMVVFASASVALLADTIHNIGDAITQLFWVAAAGLIGFIGNEVVAMLRIRVGRERAPYNRKSWRKFLAWSRDRE